jgi:iron(III) transport system ATP-binding protein
MTSLEVQYLSKQYPNGLHPAVNDISFNMQNGEILALVGPSGCGKTTTLRLIAGLERPDSGDIRIGGKLAASQLTFIPPEKRGIGMVFQDHALFPHLTVFDNVAFGLRGRKKGEIQQTVSELLHLVGLVPLAKRFPHALSGGEKQRVALARALAPRPVVVLMDEPFSSLDTDLRIEMREQVRSLLKTMQASVVFVTHDQEEALFMGDRLAVFRKGKIEQIGTPEQIYQESATRFVAEFMGNSSFLPGKIRIDGINTGVGLLLQPVSFPEDMNVEVAVRADDVNFLPDNAGNGVIIRRVYRGTMNLYSLQLDSGRTLDAFKEHNDIMPVGTRVNIFIDAGHPLCVFPQ